jgi:hypothetical protein
MRKLLKYNKNKYEIIPLILLVSPSIAFAAGLTGLIDDAFGIVTSTLIPLAFTLCLFYFFWGVAKYIRTGAGSEKASEEGKRVMIWGVVGLFVAVSVWGIISFIRSELGVPAIDKANISN